MRQSALLRAKARQFGRGAAAILVSLALGFGYLGVEAAPARAADGFTIPDTELAACVNAAIGGHVGNDYGTYDLYGLTTLTCDGLGISDLTGLDNAPYLAELNVPNNQLRSLDSAPLSSVQTLDISNNHIADVSALHNASHLTTLSATGQTFSWTIPLNEATAIPVYNSNGGVPATLTSVAPELTIGDGEVTGTVVGQYALDFDSLAGAGEFSGTVTVIVAESAVHIPDSGFAQCLADDLGLIGSDFGVDAVAAIETLDCSGRGITNLSGAEYLTGATSLDFSGNALTPSADNTDPLAALSGLTSLTTLNLSAAGLTGIATLASLTGLVNLDISSNGVSDISALGSLAGLVSLDATGQQLTQTVEADTATTLAVSDRLGNPPEFATVTGVSIESGQVTAEAGIYDLSFANATSGEGDPVTFSGTLELRAHVDVHFESPALAACIADQLEVHPTPEVFSNLDLAPVVGVYCPDSTIMSLEGMQYLTNLASFDAPGNSIADLTPLATLHRLASLNLIDNKIADLSPLAGLTELQVLYVSDNMLSNIDTLAGLSALSHVKLANNHLTDLDALSGLTGLHTVYVSGNQLTDLSAISGMGLLQTLDASDNQLSDVADFTTANRSLRTVLVAGNQISSLAGVEKLSKLGTLDASGNRISSLAPLSTRSSLMVLNVSSNNLTSLSPLASLPLLLSVKASDNQITDVSPLAGKSMLGEIELHHNQISDLSSLSASTAYTINVRNQTVSLNVVPQVATAIPLLDRSGAVATLGELPDGLSVADGKITADAEGTYSVTFRSGDFAATGEEFSGTLTVVAAYHTFTVPTPTISGSAQVDATLTVDPGTWDPEPTALSYQWQTNGVDIEGATSSTYQVRAADLGAEISVVVTATRDEYAPATVTASVTVPVVTASFTAPDDVTLSGTFEVGNTVSVDAGTWDPTPQQLAYQWLRNGVAITDANAASYTLTADDANKAVSVRVTASKDGYANTSLTSAATVVALGTISGDKPVIVGTVAIGQTLQVGTGYWSPSPSLSCQWYRAGYAIPGATGYTYEVTAADVGTAITVAQTGAVVGYQSLTVLSDPTTAVPQGTLSAPASISVSGSMAVGQTLFADPGAWSPEPDAFSYQWKRDGSALSGKTSASYALGADDEGHLITVAVTARKTGYADATATSTSSTEVAAGSFASTQPTISGTPVFGQVLSASLSAWQPTANLAWQWLRDGVAIDGATGSNYLLGVADIGAAISVQVTGSAAGYADATTTSAVTDPVAAAQLTGPGSVTVSGENAVGQTLRVDSMTWTPTPDKISYQWLRDGVAVDDATAATYELSSADLDAKLTVQVSVERTGYTTVVLTSEAGESVAASSFTATAPVISGNAIMGQTLHATTGGWSPLPTSLSYAWFADGDSIPDADTSSFQLTPDEVGKAITVAVTGTRSGYAAKTVTSEATSAVAAAQLSGPAEVTVTGVYSVGAVLSADAGTWTPTPDAVSYQWLRSGSAITGATESEYTLTPADAGAVVTVRVQVTKAGYTPVTVRSVAPGAVARATFVTPVPTINGEAAIGETLTVTVGSWTPTPTSQSIQWRRDGTAIASATGSSYQLTAADADSRITVAVSGSADGYADATVVSDATVAVLPGVLTGPDTISVSGTPAVGKTLHAAAGTWSPEVDRVRYQWLRDGSPIEGATSVDYTLAVADLGALVTVKVTGEKLGYTNLSVTSQSSTAVAKGTIVVEKPTISGQGQVGRTLTARPGAWSPMPTTWSYQWYRDGDPIEDADQAEYVLTEADIAANITVAVSGSRDGYEDTAAVESDPIEVSPQGTFAAPDEIAVRGSYAVGQTLTAERGTWTPTPSTFSYQWLRSGQVIGGATEATYTLSVADLGKVITVKVTGSSDGYRSASARSLAPSAVATASFVADNPRVLGTPRVNEVLTATPGSWTPEPTLSYQWYRSGVVIGGATAATYRVVAADVGKKISVAVTGKRAGYAAAVRKSATTSAVAKGILKGSRPTIVGKNKTGRLLKVKKGTWPSGVAVKYRWLRNGKAIKGATRTGYRLTAADRGKRIQVQITVRKAGYVTTKVVSIRPRKTK
jgi:Leucine-rich repeat (LRR) protein